MRNYLKLVPAVALVCLAVGCQTAPKNDDAKISLSDDSNATLEHFYRTDSTFKTFIDSSAGYAVFPSVGKGGLIVGGGYGRGIVYEGGKAVGFSDISKVSVGGVAGAQTVSEILVFQTANALSNFKAGEYALAADATAVAMKDGVAASAKSTSGVVVFTDSKGGLMADFSVGGQKFSYVAMTDRTSGMIGK